MSQKRESNMKAKYFVGQKVFFYSQLFVVKNELVTRHRTYKPFTSTTRKGEIDRVIQMTNGTFKYRIQPLDGKETSPIFRHEGQVFEEVVLRIPKYTVDDGVFILCESVHKVLCPYCDNHIINKTISDVCKARITEVTINKNGITYWLHKYLKGELGKINVRLNESCVYVSKREAIEALVEKMLDESI